MEKIKQLRKIGLVFDVSGTAIPIANTKLFQGGFGFVVLQAYVPITQNRSETSYPLCTTYQITIDNAGQRRQFNDLKHNMLYVGDVTLEQGDYMLYECPLPKSYTDTVGQLEIMIEYCEVVNDEIVSRITSNVFSTTVYEGAISTGVSIDPTGGELARLNAITIQMEILEDSVDTLLDPPDVSDANLVGIANVEITPLGNLKFSYLKGETGTQGQTGDTGNGIDRIELVDTVDLVDTYKIYYTDGTTKDYTVTNGEKGDPSTLDKIASEPLTDEDNNIIITEDGSVITLELMSPDINLSDRQNALFGTIDNPIEIDTEATVIFNNYTPTPGFQKSFILYIKRTAAVAVTWQNITKWAYGEIPLLPINKVQKILVGTTSGTNYYGTAGDYFDV